MKPGDILCLENTRFHKEEEKNDPAFAKQLAAGHVVLTDIRFANDGTIEPASLSVVRSLAKLMKEIPTPEIPKYGG